MGSLNLNEVGQPIRINLGDDISLSTPTLILQPEIGITKEITSGVTIPAVNITIGDETLLANEYIEYFTKDGDLDYVGRWRFKAKLDFSSSDIRQTDFQKFRVLA
ncbi:MAG: hypothetical protein HRU18_00700 [Pseudoalteromonas sp.]|uniref:hypothetical protein n=1 Tax=Pseudoalteromonas sp. TaxID=53249 RepID=UPI001DE1F6F4|nr:hypothetical protein [Pseudoalteromonas sp.]NRA76698.1 hypothetical protein [Pseudoalteromonas sp.]